MKSIGNSLVVAGSRNRIHVHIHANEPAKVFSICENIGNVDNQKADDMFHQQKIVTNQEKRSVAIINLSKIQQILEKKLISTNTKLDLSTLQKSQLVNKKYSKLKLLGAGELKEKFDVVVNGISNSAREKIEKLGGKVTLIK